MAEDVGESDSENTGALKGLKLALVDWKIWWLSLALTAQVIGLSCVIPDFDALFCAAYVFFSHSGYFHYV